MDGSWGRPQGNLRPKSPQEVLGSALDASAPNPPGSDGNANDAQEAVLLYAQEPLKLTRARGPWVVAHDLDEPVDVIFRAQVERLFAWHDWQNRALSPRTLDWWDRDGGRHRSRLSECTKVVTQRGDGGLDQLCGEGRSELAKHLFDGHGAGVSPRFLVLAGQIRVDGTKHATTPRAASPRARGSGEVARLLGPVAVAVPRSIHCPRTPLAPSGSLSAQQNRGVLFGLMAGTQYADVPPMKLSTCGRFVVLETLHMDREVVGRLALWADDRGISLQDAIQLAVVGFVEAVDSSCAHSSDGRLSMLQPTTHVPG